VKVYLNGAFVAAAEARIDASDRGLSLGDGLFETIAVAGGRVKRIPAHLARLKAGAQILDLRLPWLEAELAAALEGTAAVNRLSAGALRLTVTRGPGPRGLSPPAKCYPTLLIAPHSGAPPAGPVRAVIATETRRNERSPLARIKCLSSLDNLLARREAIKRGADDALLLNTQGRVAEATASNLFLVLEGELVTPPVADGALPGVVRAAIVAALGAREQSIAPEDLSRASQAFLTNALGVRVLGAIDGRPLGEGKPGPAFAKAAAVWAR
jgi:branched-chain amino acid aminotransferase